LGELFWSERGDVGIVDAGIIALGLFVGDAGQYGLLLFANH
jgi:hypothetical protein